MKSSNEDLSPPRSFEASTPQHTRPPAQVAEATSAGSRADYSCYTLRGSSQTLSKGRESGNIAIVDLCSTCRIFSGNSSG